VSTHDLRHELGQADLAMRDAAYAGAVLPALGRLMHLWFRSEVRGMGSVPAEGGALLVCRHRGGAPAVDVPILAAAFVAEFGAERPLFLPSLDLPVSGLTDLVLRRAGFLPDAGPTADDPAVAATLDAGAVTVVVLPEHGDDGAYARQALEAGVPIVPVVSIGGHEGHLHRTAATAVARRLRLDALARRVRVPGSGLLALGLLPAQLPLPTKIVTQVLEPVAPGDLGLDSDTTDPADVAAAAARLDTEVRRRMDAGLDELARARRFPVLG
jgi:1-acyl-sn-glycerol-3-phosphate acyltransferase